MTTTQLFPIIPTLTVLAKLQNYTSNSQTGWGLMLPHNSWSHIHVPADSNVTQADIYRLTLREMSGVASFIDWFFQCARVRAGSSSRQTQEQWREGQLSADSCCKSRKVGEGQIIKAYTPIQRTPASSWGDKEAVMWPLVCTAGISRSLGELCPLAHTQTHHFWRVLPLQGSPVRAHKK